MNFARLACLLSVLAAPAAALAANPPAQPGPCNRACLEGFVDRYLDARRYPLAARVGTAAGEAHGSRLVGDVHCLASFHDLLDTVELRCDRMDRSDVDAAGHQTRSPRSATGAAAL